jgi:hypothetical protein
MLLGEDAGALCMHMLQAKSLKNYKFAQRACIMPHCAC